MKYGESDRRWQWSQAPSVPLTDPLYSWLTERQSLTRRLRSVCKEFRVAVHQSNIERVCPDEMFLLTSSDRTTLVREVSLICDEQPVVFGHSILMTRKKGQLAQLFQQTGDRALGALLFACPEIRRGTLYFKRIDRQHALYAKSVASLGETSLPFFEARRSVFSLRSERVCVTEVFSPRLTAGFSLKRDDG